MALVVIPATEAAVLVDATPSPLDRVTKLSSNVTGRGLIRPFRRDDKNDFANAESVELVKACVGQILGMMGSSEISQGELEWDPERGSLTYLLRHQKNDLVLQELGRVYVIDALRRWEPRLLVRAASVTREKTDSGDETILLIRLLYDIISTNVPGNNVLVKDVKQTVTLAMAA